ncbi:MAG TPA: aminotransferase class I/II-fold pyridoxal phosphate-dependent enzyme [Acidimicrobiales bacterium]|nr:aminotransferase class I/II-fold pyridoxal phosphate-dependent enzyme [Acidimicrobiales bacterium]
MSEGRGGAEAGGTTTRRRGFVPPAYPYDRLRDLERLADAHPGGVVDCSIGTPTDPPPRSAVRALAISGTERGYPTSVGSPALRRAAADWMQRRFEVTVELADIAACVGTKEMVASTAQYLHLRDPDRDTVLYPAVSYPTYAMGATLAGCRAVPVPPTEPDGTGLDLAAIDPADAERALLVWANSPSNPTGGLTALAAVAGWGRERSVPVFSDECYAEFSWGGPPRSVLQAGPSGVVAVHSLSKRSNLAGLRVGFYAGDPELVAYLREVRRHAGLMVAGPVQAAAAVALTDDAHVDEQRERYLERLSYLASVLTAAGCPVGLPSGGFYLWVPVPAPWPDTWALTEHLARAGGLLVSPGDLYGPLGAGHVRVAVVQPMERLRLVADRLHAA